MSLYDELGVRQNATPEEVREHYRVLVRLFHPDQFSDPALKAAAEGQMRRFNAIAKILTDPEQRLQYEAETNSPIVIQALQPAMPARRMPWNSVAWGAAAMACAGAIVWVSDHEPAPAAPAVEVRTVVESAPPVSTGTDWRARARTAIAERDQAFHELARLRNERSQLKLAPPMEPPLSTVASAESPVPLALPTPRPAIENETRSNRFAGIWFYARRPGAPGKLYAPEFIETQITERDGQVRGRYRSRYRVTDQAISPTVNFEFAGQAAGASAKMPFIREDGGRGEVRLRLISEREMEFAWTASGSAFPSLTSGTAILVKGQ